MCNYKLEKASPNHRKFILDCILEASKSGHFNPIFYQQKNNKQMISGLEFQIDLTLNYENMPTSNGNFVSSKLYVYLQNGNPCAMSWIQGEEIYLF
ncbi:hypothetical protein ACERCG_10795 [Mannheimia sp. E30BD]|uniref:hypothetical protein n=1 Tax=Mannheimia sp. E30BD TaxID=3278708 RepID=UPI00359DB732